RPTPNAQPEPFDRIEVGYSIAEVALRPNCRPRRQNPARNTISISSGTFPAKYPMEPTIGSDAANSRATGINPCRLSGMLNSSPPTVPPSWNSDVAICALAPDMPAVLSTVGIQLFEK